MKENMNICPICESGQLHEKTELEETTYKGVTAQTPLYYSICDACGSEQGNAAQSRKNKQAMLSFKKQVDGFLSGEEIRELRQHWGITQGQAAKIFGGGPVAFSKYEADDVMQSEPMDKLLRAARALPQTFLWLAQQAGEHEVFHQARQRTFNLMEKHLNGKSPQFKLIKPKPGSVSTVQSNLNFSTELQAVG